MTRKLTAYVLALTISFVLLPTSVNAAIKAGATCKKVGLTTLSSGITYTCIKSGKKIVWDSGKQNLNNSKNPNNDAIIYAGIKNPVPANGWISNFPLPTKEDSSRGYVAYIPSSWKSNVASPLLIALHGLSGWGVQFMDNTGFNNLAEANGFIVVYPDGTGEKLGGKGIRSWNGGRAIYCASGNCPASQIGNVDDVGFIGRLIDDVSSRYSIDPKKVYLTGHSDGSQLAHRLACQLSNRIAAIAVVAGHLAIDSCNPDSPVSVLQIYGTEDTLNPEFGGIAKIAFGAYSFESNSRPLMKSVQMMAEANACSTNYSENNNFANKDLTIYTWSGCKNGAVVSSLKIAGASHAWMGHPSQSEESTKLSGDPYMKIDASKVVWSFLSNKVKN